MIGSGGAGSVYQATDTALQKLVAIKVLHKSADQAAAVRFQREAKLAGSLCHENVLAVLDFGFTKANDPYIVLDFINGESLAARLDREGGIPTLEALRLFLQIAAGIAHAHRNNVVHRDIKPSNIMLVPKPNQVTKRVQGKQEFSTSEFGHTSLSIGSSSIVKIVDFGIAKGQSDEHSITKSGRSMGTPLYMSPEQIRGDNLDARTDIYSFGCVMFETLTGRPPFQSETMLETGTMHLFHEPPPLSDTENDQISPDLENIIHKCMAKDPADRFESAEQIKFELILEIQRILSDRATSHEQKELTPGESQHRKPLSIFKHPVTLLAVLLTAGAALVAFVLQPREDIVQPAKTDNTHFMSFPPVTEKSAKIKSASADRVVAETEDDLVKELAKTSNERLDLTGSVVSASALRKSNLSHVRTLTCRFVKIDPQLIDVFTKMASLEKLRLGGVEDFNYDALTGLNACPRLSELTIFRQALPESAFVVFSSLNLTGLDLTGCSGITPKNLEHLKKLPKLSKLVLDQTDVTNEGLKSLESFHIRSLGLRNVPGINADGLESIAKMENIRDLDLRGNTKINHDDVAHLMKLCPQLSRPNFGTFKASHMSEL
jgi:serine/threonine protein kinase